MIGCVYYNNSTHVSGTPLINEGAIALSADPYVNQAGADFRLNNNSPGGADIRGLGFGVYGQIDNVDVGAVQRAGSYRRRVAHLQRGILMADYVELNPGTAGAKMKALKTAAGENWAVDVVCYATTLSPDANVLVPVTPSSGMPVAQQGAWSFTANAGADLNTSALALEAGGNLAAINGKTPALGQALAAGSVPVVLTAAQLAALTPVSVIAVSNFPATQPVSGTFWQATQPVSIATLPALAAGTANIGDVDVLTLPPTPAGTNLIGQVSASDETGTIYSGTTALTPKFAIFNTSSGATIVVAAVGGKRIKVLSWGCSANGTTNIKWQSHTAGDISGLRYMTQFKDTGGGTSRTGRFQTAVGESLDINNSAAVAISGEVAYVEVP